jgi:ribosomal-protein-alanine N-acetyltransferase
MQAGKKRIAPALGQSSLSLASNESDGTIVVVDFLRVTRARELGARFVPVTFQPMDKACAQAVLNWHYDPPYDVYNVSASQSPAVLRELLDPRNAYYCITGEAGELLAFCCFGIEARVPGGNYSHEALDIGFGVRPDLTGQGRGLSFVQAVLTFAVWIFAPYAFRVTIAEFNKRAIKVWKNAGFQPVQTFARQVDGMVFVILTRKV